MKRSKAINFPAVMFWALTAGCFAVIFYFSSCTATDSADQSASILKILYAIFGRNVATDFIVRKCAHFLEYTGAALLMSAAFYYTLRKNRLYLPVACTSLYAVTDEIHQIFVEGRSCELRDWAIDTLGALLGTAIFYIIYLTIQKLRQMKSRRTEKMNVLVFDTEEQIGIAAGYYMCGQVLQKPDSVLGLATGSTPLKAYKHMVSLYEQGAVDFSKVTTFNLDEYCNLNVKDRNSYHTFMYQNLFDHINIPDENINFLNGNAYNLELECDNYEKKIKAAGGIDIQLLGIGSNGHIAFNEPADSFQRWSHVVQLKESTIQDNSRFFDSVDEVPTHAVTMGIGSIMQAKRILIIALGTNKAKAIKQLIEGDVTPKCPASVLQFHTDVTLMLDRDAASLL